jgi:hypothetical protein
MLIGNLIDTILNVVTFAFLGAMIWLAVRDLPDRGEDSR